MLTSQTIFFLLSTSVAGLDRLELSPDLGTGTEFAPGSQKLLSVAIGDLEATALPVLSVKGPATLVFLGAGSLLRVPDSLSAGIRGSDVRFLYRWIDEDTVADPAAPILAGR